MIQYSISELERLTGIKAATLRMWEKRYEICCPCRDDNNVRRYTDGDLRRLIKIGHLTEAGHKISSVACLSCDELEKLYRQSLHVRDPGCCFLDRMNVALEDLRDAELLHLLGDRLDKLGIVGFFHEVWIPMQERIRILIMAEVFREFHLRHFEELVIGLLHFYHLKQLKRNGDLKETALILRWASTDGEAADEHFLRCLLFESGLETVSLQLDPGERTEVETIFATGKFCRIYLRMEQNDDFIMSMIQEISDRTSKEVEVIAYGSGQQAVEWPPNLRTSSLSEMMQKKSLQARRESGVQVA